MKRQRPIPPCPASGNGVHNWLMRAGWACLSAGMSEKQSIAYLHEKMTRLPNPHNEVEAAVEKVFSEALRHGEPCILSPKWASLDLARRNHIIGKSAGLSELLGERPFSDGAPHTEEIIDALFPGNPLLCCGASSREFATRPRSEWRGKLAKLQLIVPSPMSAKFGVTKSGKKSQHTLSNTGPRRFLVVEQDRGSLDEQAAILAHLAKRAPLTLVVHSGGKSLHGWFFCEGRSEESSWQFLNGAVSIGADHTTWTRSQFVRMPDGTRDTGARQAVLYFNAEVLK
jgi:hypothetical protein